MINITAKNYDNFVGQTFKSNFYGDFVLLPWRGHKIGQIYTQNGQLIINPADVQITDLRVNLFK